MEASEGETGTSMSALDSGGEALQQWARQAHTLASVLEKLVAVAQDDELLTEDQARRYSMSCTFFARGADDWATKHLGDRRLGDRPPGRQTLGRQVSFS